MGVTHFALTFLPTVGFLPKPQQSPQRGFLFVLPVECNIRVTTFLL